MKTSSRPLLRRSLLLAAIGVLVAVLTACTGRGGGYLPPRPRVHWPSVARFHLQL